MLTIALAATLAGARGYLAIAEYAAGLSQAQLKRLRGYYSHTRKRFEPPSEPTVRRVLSQVDPDALEQAFAAWVQAHMPDDDALAIDGKTLKGARASDGKAKQLLAALFHQHGTVLAQTEVTNKTNEIPTLRQLLEPLPIGDRVVTADALHTQHDTARFLVEDKQAHYLFTVKDNQKTLLEDLKAFDWEAFPPPHHTTVDKGHGRIEQRTIRTTTALNAYLRFPHVGQVAMVERQVTTVKTGQQTVERVLASIRNFIIGLIRRMITSPRLFIPSVLRYFAARPVQALAVFTR